MRFEIGEQYRIGDGEIYRFCLSDDSSLTYKSPIRFKIYNISLGGNWRIQLIADCDTGRCIKVECYLSGIIAERTSLSVPKSEQRELHFIADEIMRLGEGCCYTPFSDEISYDAENRILCFGNHTAVGRAIEFAPKTIAVVDNGSLKCVYLLLDDVSDISAHFGRKAIPKKHIFSRLTKKA